MKRLAFAIFLFSTACMAQGDKPKPSSPTPKPAVVRPNDWKATLLTASLAGAALYDGASTKAYLRDCVLAGYGSYCRETDPASRFVLGRMPQWLPNKRSPGMLLGGGLEAISSQLVAVRMRRSQNEWVRRLWWAPQTALIAVHLCQGSRNFISLANTRRRT